MRVMQRDIELMQLLYECRWLSTRQIQRTFFAEVSRNAVNKRLHKLVSGEYLYAARRSRLDEYFYRLKPKALRLLSRACGEVYETALEGRTLPGDLEHFKTINDVRLACKKAAQVQGWHISLFLGDRDVKKAFPHLSVVPDAFVLLTAHSGQQAQEKQLCIEVDLGTENLRTLMQKLEVYDHETRSPLAVLAPKGCVVLFCHSRPRVVHVLEKILQQSPAPEKYYLASLSDVADDWDFAKPVVLSLRRFLTGNVELLGLFDI